MASKIGKRISEVLVEWESILWEYESEMKGPANFTDEGFRAALKIFMAVFLEKMYKLQEAEGIDKITRHQMAGKAGLEIRNIIKTYTNIDTHKIYDK